MHLVSLLDKDLALGAILSPSGYGPARTGPPSVPPGRPRPPLASPRRTRVAWPIPTRYERKRGLWRAPRHINGDNVTSISSLWLTGKLLSVSQNDMLTELQQCRRFRERYAEPLRSDYGCDAPGRRRAQTTVGGFYEPWLGMQWAMILDDGRAAVNGLHDHQTRRYNRMPLNLLRITS